MRQFGLPVTVIHDIQRIVSSHPAVTECIVYGSRAKGTFREGSDIDLSLRGTVDSDELDRIEIELDDLNLPWIIDLSAYSQLDNPALIDHIDRVGKTLWPST